MLRKGDEPSLEERGLEELFVRCLLAQFPLGVVGVGEDRAIHFANEAALKLLGVSREKAVGRRLTETALPCSHCSARSASSQSNCTRLVRRKTPGREHVLLWSCTAAPAEVGMGGCTVGLLDVTSEIEQLSETVYRSKEEIEAIFDSITDPTILVDQDCRIRRVNTAFARFCNLDYRSLVGQGCSEVMSEECSLCEDEHVRAVIRQMKPLKAERKVEGGKVFVVNYFPVEMKGVVKGVVVRFHEISQEKAMEMQLIHSEKMAAVGQLVAGVAHEINNPTAFINSNLNRLGELSAQLNEAFALIEHYVEAGEAGASDPRDELLRIGETVKRLRDELVLEDFADIVTESSDGIQRIQKIVGDLKLFSHRGTDSIEATDINACIESTLNIVWNELKYKCEVVREFGDMPRVVCNRQQIGQAIMNLLVNAGHAIKKSGVITISTREVEGGVSIEIRDTGSGISEENLPKLFEPFFTTKPIGQGTGLGLYHVAKFVRLQGGTIGVTSKVGEGTCFTITIPLSPPADRPEAVQ